MFPAPTLNLKRALPPAHAEAHFYPGGSAVEQGEINNGGTENPSLLLVRISAGVVCVDSVYATIVVPSLVSAVQFSSGFTHGCRIGADSPVNIGEAVVLHALRVLREWIQSADQRSLSNAHISEGDALANYQIKKWMRTGQCDLQSAAASGSSRRTEYAKLARHPHGAQPPFLA